MSRARPRPRTLVAHALALASGLLLAGCLKTNATDSESPGGPSEESEAASLAVIEAGLADGADEDAKRAAAQEVLQKVKDRDPEEEKKKLAKSLTISAQAQALLDEGNLTEAVDTAREALKVHEQNVDAMLVLGHVFYKQGKFELVSAVTGSALQVDAKIRTPKQTSRAYNLQGFAMLATGDDTRATVLFKKAAEVDDQNAAAWNNLGTRYLDVGDVNTAAACFEYAIGLDPRFYKAQLNYGAALRAQRKWEEAEAAIRKAMELRPNYAEAYFNLGVLYLDADPFPGLDTVARLNKAIQNLAKYRELAPDDPPRPGAGRGPGLGSDGKAPPPRVSKARADDYIRVANKGIERERRRLEREQQRQAKPAQGDPEGDPSAAPTEAPSGDTAVGDPPATHGGDETAPDDAAPEQPAGDPSTPADPAPQEPSKPAPQEPSKPAPQGPSKPAPQEPSKPAPQGPSKPAPKPAPKPVKPAPQGPTPQPPPAQPSPQKPSPQKPQSVSHSVSLFVPWAPSPSSRLTERADLSSLPPWGALGLVASPSWPWGAKNFPRNSVWRGTRSDPSTLNPTGVGALVSRYLATSTSFPLLPISCEPLPRAVAHSGLRPGWIVSAEPSSCSQGGRSFARLEVDVLRVGRSSSALDPRVSPV